MANLWFTSDTHFGHANILKFVTADGKPVRPGFDSVDHMNEVMVARWNELVKPGDKVYHLGDVGFGNTDKLDVLLSRLNGRKRLILGNHDDWYKHNLHKHFERLYTMRFFKKEGDFVVTHMPLHETSISKVTFNVHGHIHEKPDIGPRYLNISVERTDFRPVHLDEILVMLEKKR